ncbi:DUF441 domain-containing protein [Brevibacillus marinus]|uniref:DUF441 domain-containing protein n=1 Tax=Brevibacillus marinus TaxID=2496837 RepID=UPI000F816D36|nr:DUF441 domain-containing protein [Brevibacillus marinus]
MNVVNLILLVLLALGILGGNTTIAIAICFLLMLRLLNLEGVFPYLEQYGLQVGIVVLTIGVLSPLASGKISVETMLQTLRSWQSLLAILVGAVVAYLGGRGATFMADSPLVVTGLMVGTIIGVAFFRGVPVGPLIAAGIVAFILQFVPKA